MDPGQFSSSTSYIWGIADDLLRDFEHGEGTPDRRPGNSADYGATTATKTEP